MVGSGSHGNGADLDLEIQATALLAALPPDPERPWLNDGQQRRRRQRETIFCEDLAEAAGSDLERIEARAELEERLAGAGLTVQERTCLVLTTGLGFGQRDLVFILGISLRSIQAHLSEARRKLRATGRTGRFGPRAGGEPD
jgi:DNA-directed RNA polymerase specialized sigma24 family protein